MTLRFHVERSVLLVALATLAAPGLLAQQSPQPDPAELVSDVYVDFPESEMWPFQTAATRIRT